MKLALSVNATIPLLEQYSGNASRPLWYYWLLLINYEKALLLVVTSFLVSLRFCKKVFVLYLSKYNYRIVLKDYLMLIAICFAVVLCNVQPVVATGKSIMPDQPETTLLCWLIVIVSSIG